MGIQITQTNVVSPITELTLDPFVFLLLPTSLDEWRQQSVPQRQAAEQVVEESCDQWRTLGDFIGN